MRTILVLVLLATASCAGSSTGTTIKSIFDLAVELCEISVKDHPELVPPGKVVDQICKDAAFLQPFLDQLLSAQRFALKAAASTAGGELKAPAPEPTPTPAPTPDAVPDKP